MSNQGLDDPLSRPRISPGIGSNPLPTAGPGLGTPAGTGADNRRPAPAIERTAVDSIDAIVRSLYGSIYPANLDGGEEITLDARLRWDRFRALFDAHARLVRVAGDQTTTMTPDEFIAAVDAGPQRPVSERELARRTDTYAGIAHVFSSYDRVRSDGTSVRGINTIQLRNDGCRWWITSLMWADEHADDPMPSRYLPRH